MLPRKIYTAGDESEQLQNTETLSQMAASQDLFCHVHLTGQVLSKSNLPLSVCTWHLLLNARSLKKLDLLNIIKSLESRYIHFFIVIKFSKQYSFFFQNHLSHLKLLKYLCYSIIRCYICYL